ncbi:MAG TPA: extracellular solute-binding protein [Myxococcota bacterium]|nr:extracellular solute-binding protein [Myxococcota bacterium]
MRSRWDWALAALALCASLVAESARAGEVARAHGIAMHGDLKYPADFAHFDYANPSAPKGGVLRQYAIGTFDSFNPFIIKGNPAAGVGSIYDSLMVQSHDEPFSMYGLLAESVELPSDRSWVAFTLREGARWHDGRPISVDDVIWSFQTLVEKGAPLFRFYYAGVEKVEKTGVRSVAFRFKPGENRELPLILGQLPIFPKHFWETRSFDETSLEPPLGSGPYELAEFEPGRFVSYRRRADYWGADLPVSRGHHNFDVMRFDYYRDMDVAVEALKADAYDVRNENSATKWATAYDTRDVREGRLRKELIPNSRNQGVQGFVFNLRREKFKERRVREAISYAFDFEWMNRNLFYGQYERVRSYFENSELAARGAPSPVELEILEPLRGRIPEEVFASAYQPPTTDGSGRVRENLRRATELFAQAGWSIRDGKLANAASGESMQFEILLVDPSLERVALPFKKNLERLGIGVDVRTVDVAQYRRRLDTYDFDMTTLRLGQSNSPGNEQRDFWSSASAQHEGGRNLAGIASPAIDELIELVIAATTREDLVARVRALDRVLQWGIYLVPHFYIAADRLLYWDRFGMPEVVPSDGPVLDTWWYDAQKAARLERARGGGD